MKKYLQLLSFCHDINNKRTIITTLPVEFRNVKTVWNNLNDVDKNMTTLTAKLIAQKKRNKNRHEPGEAFTNALSRRVINSCSHIDIPKIIITW
jgi:hypothetical protein